MTEGARPSLPGGPELRDAFAAAAAHLREVAGAVDAINVYPVPDGDTGSNMAATLREASDQAGLVGPPVTVAAVLGALARGSLYGARGNSGVILSQALRGLAEGVGDREWVDAAALAEGLRQAAAGAYRAVSKPVEGTMLTVLREAGEWAVAEAARLPDGGRGHPCLGLLGPVIEAAERAEAATIDQLPALAEAGVPDAGGEGICVILRGLYAALAGRAPRPPVLPERAIATMAGHASEGFGYCTEFVLEAGPGPIVVELVRELAERGNRSVVVVGDERAVRVHAHSEQPEALLEGAAALGRVSRAKVDDMSAQNVRFRSEGSGATAKVALLAMSRGAGIDQVFQSLGAAVADLGEVVKPPAGEIAAAAEGLGVADVIVLPNHKNVILAAEQAKGLARCSLHVLPTESIPQGIAAAVAFNGAENVKTNLAAMRVALGGVATVEVTVAAADRSADGVQARKGEYIAIFDDRLVASRADLGVALVAGLGLAGASTAALVTLYTGAAVREAEGVGLVERVRAEFPGVEVERIEGGQPLYPVIASVE